MADDLGVGVIGCGWMGSAHARAYLRLPQHYPDLPRRPRLLAVADPVQARLDDAVARFAVERAHRDWRDLIADPRIEVVSVTTPHALHRELGEAVARAGKHLWIEKPVGIGLPDARAVADAVAAAGVVGVVGFNYRHVPAVVRARELLAAGAVGVVTHARFQLLTDYAADPRGPLSWRFERSLGGDGVLGDLASHGVDLVRYLLGEIDQVMAQTAVFIPRRPLADGAGGHYAVVEEAAGTGPVENEDYLVGLLRAASGALVTLEASRVSVGDQNSYGFEIHGTRGQLRWDFRRLGELAVCTGAEYNNRSVAVEYSRPGHGEHQAFSPGAGVPLGFEDLKVIEAGHLVAAVAGAPNLAAGLPDAVASAAVLAAAARSAASGRWVAPEGSAAEPGG
jgi:predicted dehydrogenase